MTSLLRMSMQRGCGEKEEQSLRTRSSKMSEDRWDSEELEIRAVGFKAYQSVAFLMGFGRLIGKGDTGMEYGVMLDDEILFLVPIR